MNIPSEIQLEIAAVEETSRRNRVFRALALASAPVTAVVALSFAGGSGQAQEQSLPQVQEIDALGGNGNDGSKTTICHRTKSFSNPYTIITVDNNAVDGLAGNSGQQPDHFGEHQGPIFDGVNKSWGDIIPDKDNAGNKLPHNGLNYSAAGQAILSNGCKIAKPPTPTTTPEVTVPEDTTPEVTTPEVTVPEDTTPEVTTPEVTVPEDTTPEVTTPLTTPDQPAKTE
jgi:hypothetical protein